MRELRQFIEMLATESGEIIRGYFRSEMSVELKSDASPVTVADKKAEEKLRDLIMRTFPEHGIVGEEFGAHNEGAPYQWILDPIDGTKSFICGMVTFGSLIGLLKDGKPILGAIHQPVTRELMIGDNEQTELNGSAVRMRPCRDIREAVCLTTDHLSVEKYKKMAPFEKLIREVLMYRTWGDCYGYMLLAAGFADIMIDPKMSIWDTAALVPVIHGAGGVITDFEGRDPVKGDSVIAASVELHEQVLARFN